MLCERESLANRRGNVVALPPVVYAARVSEGATPGHHVCVYVYICVCGAAARERDPYDATRRALYQGMKGEREREAELEADARRRRDYGAGIKRVRGRVVGI